MFDDDDDDLERSEFDCWYDDNNMYFRRGADAFVEPDLDIELFYSNVYCKVMSELAPAVRKFIRYQYPVFETEYRPAVLDAIERIVLGTGHRFMLELYNLIQDQKEAVNLRGKYPDFEEWEKRKKELRYFSRSIFNAIEGLTEKQKTDLYELAKDKFQESYNYKEQRLYEFIEMIQPILFQYYPVVQELNADGWIVYFHLLLIEHTDYRLDFEHYVTFINYDFEESDLNIPYAEFRKKFQEKFDERWKKEQEEREKK